MKIYEYSSNLKVDFASSVVALGLFDGVHKGHRALLAAAKKEAKTRKLPLAVFTFFSENEMPKGTGRLYSTKIKNELFEKLGAEYVIYADFNKISGMDAESFVRSVLVRDLGAHLTLTGHDFRFGKDREGDTKLLSDIMRKSGGEHISVPDELASGEKISTSLIKKLLSKGEARLAGELLGEPYFIEGEIVKGDGRGTALGLPTVNISLQNNQDFVKNGVYCSKVVICGKSYTGLTNIGKCPTFEERERHAETFILDFSENVYGKHVRIYLIDFLREEKRFSGKNELLSQIECDLERVKSTEKEKDYGR